MSLTVTGGVDLRPLLSAEIANQGDRPLCGPFATSLAHEASRRASQDEDPRFAPEALWWRCYGRGETVPTGVNMSYVESALAAVGQPLLSTWPYNPSLGSGTEEPPPVAGTAPWKTASTSAVDIARDGRENALTNALDDGNVAVMVIGVTASFWAASGGLVSLNPTDQFWDWHAVACVGYGLDFNSEPIFLIQNSWGDGWGDAGRALLTADYISAWSSSRAFTVGM